MKQIQLQDLNKNIFYVLTIETLKTNSIYVKIIRQITSYIVKNFNKNDKIIVNHNAILIHYMNEWKICEVGSGGEINYNFVFQKNKKYYISDIGEINEIEKLYIIAKYCNEKTNNLIEIFKNYSFLKAFASCEFNNIIINKLIDFIRNIYESIMTLFSFNIPVYCTESVLKTIREINNIRDAKHLFLGFAILRLIEKNNYRLDEIYPQDIIENIEYCELVN